jgi:Tfp pilus assembly protein PilN
MADAVAHRKTLSVLGLLPQRVERERQTSRLTRWLWTGAATALLLIGADAALFQSRLKFARQEAQAAQARTDDVKALQASGERLFAAISAMNGLESAIQRETSGSINLRACLQELSRLTPESVRLTGISFHHADGRTNGHIAGYALATQASGSRTQLEPFIEQLRHSPLFEKVVLTNVQAGVLGEMPGQRFEANFTGVSTPRHAPALAAAGSTGGATP